MSIYSNFYLLLTSLGETRIMSAEKIRAKAQQLQVIQIPSNLKEK